MNKKTVRVISTILTIAIVLMTLTTSLYAATNPFDGNDYTGNTSFSGNEKVKGVGNSIIGMLQIVGNIVAVAILVVLGIKYMVGSAEEKASYKKTMMPYLVGAILIFGAANLAKYIWNIANGI